MKACITALGISVLILFAIIPSAHAIDAAIWEKLTYTKKLFYDGYIDGMLKREPKTPEQLWIPSDSLQFYQDGYTQAMFDWLKDQARSDLGLPPLTGSNTTGWPWPPDVK